MVKAGIIQTKIYSSNQEGIKKVSEILEVLGRRKTDLICLPEQWLKNNKINNFDSEFSDFKEIAKKHKMTIIPGAFYQKIKYDWMICSPIIGPKGEIIGLQEKIHPFDYEKNIVKPGSKTKIFKTVCRFGVIICYDMVFPKVSETFVKKGAQILLSPSRIVRRGIKPWSIYVQARSLENRVPILAANIKTQKYGGNSMIVDLVERDKVSIPKVTTIQNEGFEVKEFQFSKYHASRKNRFSDSRKFS